MAAQEHRNFCDLVCEGGGVKGIGLAGAFSVLEEQNFRPQNVAGTSAEHDEVERPRPGDLDLLGGG